MIEILEQTIQQIKEVDINSMLKSLKSEFPFKSDEEILIVINERITYIGVQNLTSYQLLLSSLIANKKRKEQEAAELKKLLYNLMLDDIRSLFGIERVGLVELFNNEIIRESNNKNDSFNQVKP